MASEWAQIFSFRSHLIIDLQNVTKTYRIGNGTITALENALLKVKPGTLTVIVGPSGAGKTTLLHILAGLIRPDSGRVLFYGLDMSVAEDDVLRILREEFISIAYQEQSLVRYMTVEENVQLPIAIMGLGKEKYREASDTALERLGLLHRKHHRAEEISGGERQLANMARALAKHPVLILADEPTANLDQERIHLLMDVIREEIETRKTTFIIATHDPLITQYADTVIEIRDGKLHTEEGQELGHITLKPIRYLNKELSNIFKDQIKDNLLEHHLVNGEIVEALGIPFLVHGMKKKDHEAQRPKRILKTKQGGIVTTNTQIHLDTENQADARDAFEPPSKTQSIEAGQDDIPQILKDSVKEARRPRLFYTTLKILVTSISVPLLILASAIWYTLGVWTTLSTSMVIFSGFWLLLMILFSPTEHTGLPRPKGVSKLSGIPDLTSWTVNKNVLCDFCGTAWAGEMCHTCGRKMCERCWPRVLREPSFCRDHLSCPICGRDRIGNQLYTAVCKACLLCGEYVCSECYIDGFCLECLAEKAKDKKPSPEATPELSTLILEPTKDLSNDICSQLDSNLPTIISDIQTSIGDRLKAFGTTFCVAATLPLDGGRITSSTHIQAVNRRERDASLKALREKSGFPSCYYDGCDYPIKRFCWVCKRPVCPNHSTICRECGNPVCQEHNKDGICERCFSKPRSLGVKHSLLEIINPLKAPIVAIASYYIFLRVFFYGEPLRKIHPSLPLLIVLPILILPIPYMIYSAWRKKNPNQEGVKS